MERILPSFLLYFRSFLLFTGVATVMFFLQYYFHDQVPLPGNMRPEEAVSYALLPLMGCAAISSVVAGQVSHGIESY